MEKTFSDRYWGRNGHYHDMRRMVAAYCNDIPTREEVYKMHKHFRECDSCLAEFDRHLMQCKHDSHPHDWLVDPLAAD